MELKKQIIEFFQPTKEKIFITIALPLLAAIISNSHISALNETLEAILISIDIATLFPASIIYLILGNDYAFKTPVIIINYYITACIIQLIYKTAITNHTKTNTPEEKNSNRLRFIAHIFYATIGFFLFSIIFFMSRGIN